MAITPVLRESLDERAAVKLKVVDMATAPKVMLVKNVQMGKASRPSGRGQPSQSANRKTPVQATKTVFKAVVMDLPSSNSLGYCRTRYRAATSDSGREQHTARSRQRTTQQRRLWRLRLLHTVRFHQPAQRVVRGHRQKSIFL